MNNFIHKEGFIIGKTIDYWENHKYINNILYKLCNRCNEWFPCTEEYFYKTNKNNKDNLFPYCKKCNIKQSMKWIKNHPDKRKVSNRKQNSKYTHKISRRNAEKNRREDGTTKIWRLNNLEKIKIYNKKHKKHDITKEEWNKCKEYFNYKCAYCGLPLKKHLIKYNGNLINGDFHKDHVQHKGSNKLNNCVPACKQCNSEKNIFTLKEWYNKENIKYSKERYDKILQWINKDWNE